MKREMDFVKHVLNDYLRRSSRGATKLLARSLACRSFPASTLLRSRKWLQRRGPEGSVEVARGTCRSTLGAATDPARVLQVHSSVRTSAHGGGPGWRPVAVPLGCEHRPALGPVEGRISEEGSRGCLPCSYASRFTRSASRGFNHASRFFPALLLSLAACGNGGGDGGGIPSSDIGTLAYVVTECQDSGNLFSEHQSLHILHGDQDVAVMETPEVGPIAGVGGLCRGLTLTRFGQASIAREAFQGVAVSPDGTAVVFEVSDDFSVFPPLPLHLPPEQKGIFFVYADGSGLRRLGPPSQLPFFFLPTTGGIGTPSSFAFSPDGRTITFVDTGPDAAGNQAGQVWTLDVGSGLRRQVTQLPPGVPPADLPSDFAGVINPSFIDNHTIGFLTDAYGLFQGYFLVPFTVKSDGSEEPKAASFPVTLPDSQIVPTFVITGDKPAAVSIRLPGQAQNGDPLHATITEVFVVDGSNLLQLTDFRRVDTSAGGGIGAIIDFDRQTVFFTASADPLGSNPSGTCQIFAIDRLGGNSRQLTQFSAERQTTNGCFFNRPPGCAVGFLRQDSGTRNLVFYSSCDPLGSNLLGSQVFAVRPDGSDLRQLTHTLGVAPRLTQTGDTAIGELPGPFAYGPYAP